MPEFIPTILAESASQAISDIRKVDGVASIIQIDILDGTFVPERSWHDAEALKNIKIKSEVELHLMVQNPEQEIRLWLQVPSFKRAIWHIEAPINHLKLIEFCKKKKIAVGLAIAPETSASAITPYVNMIEEVLILGVHPGKSGQKLIARMKNKIKEVERIANHIMIGFDGGITDHNWRSLVRSGVDRLCVHQMIFSKSDPRSFFQSLEK